MTAMMYLFFCHWVADFVFQSSWMAENKSHNIKALMYHCMTYGIVMGMMVWNWKFGLMCFVLHVPVDFVTSKISKAMFMKWFNYIVPVNDILESAPEDGETLHDFFVVVGFDQFIHLCVLIWLSTWCT